MTRQQPSAPVQITQPRSKSPSDKRQNVERAAQNTQNAHAALQVGERQHATSQRQEPNNIGLSGGGESSGISQPHVAERPPRPWSLSSRGGSFNSGRRNTSSSPGHSSLGSAGTESSQGSLRFNPGLGVSPSLRESVRRNGHFLRRTSSFGGGPLLVRTVVPALPPLDASVATDAPGASVSAADPSQMHSADHADRKKSGGVRWLALALSCFLLFGNYYAYDNPAALNRPLQLFLGHNYDQWQYELNLLYSVYSFPNIFLPFLAGRLIDWCGPRTVLLLFSSIICAGQTLFAAGVSFRHFGLMLVGRVLFGIGGETISVVQSSITTSYFKNKEIAFALGLNLCISRFGSVVNSMLSPRIALRTDAAFAVWCGSFTCYFSFVCALILAGILSASPPDPLSPILAAADPSVVEEERVPLLSDNHEVLSPINEDDALHESQRQISNSNRSANNARKSNSWNAFILSVFGGVELLPPAFWIVCAICILLYGTVVPFNNIASDFLMSKWYHNDTQTAGIVMSIPDTMSAILVPPLGYLVDHYGGYASVLVACSAVIIFVHLTLGMTYINPVLPLIVLGLSYSLYGVAIWPSVATVTQHREDELKEKNPDSEPPRLLGTAFGISTSALNASLTVMPLVAAQIRVVGGSFMPVEIFFSGLAVLGMVFSIILWIVDLRSGGVLQNPEIGRDLQPTQVSSQQDENRVQQETDYSKNRQKSSEQTHSNSSRNGVLLSAFGGADESQIESQTETDQSAHLPLVETEGDQSPHLAPEDIQDEHVPLKRRSTVSTQEERAETDANVGNDALEQTTDEITNLESPISPNSSSSRRKLFGNSDAPTSLFAALFKPQRLQGVRTSAVDEDARSSGSSRALWTTPRSPQLLVLSNPGIASVGLVRTSSSQSFDAGTSASVADGSVDGGDVDQHYEEPSMDVD